MTRHSMQILWSGGVIIIAGIYNFSNLCLCSIIEKASSALDVLREVLDAVNTQNPEVLLNSLCLSWYCIVVQILQWFYVHFESYHPSDTFLFSFLLGIELVKNKNKNVSAP